MSAPAAPGNRPRTRAHVAFMVAFGLLGWLGLLCATYLAGSGPWSRGAAPLPFCLFLLVIFGTRSMAFRMLPETLVSLDSAFYIAAVVCLGSVSAGWLVAVALTLDALLRLVGADASARRPIRPRSTTRESLAFVLYFGGMTGGLLMAVGWLFGVDRADLLGRPDDELQVLWRVFALGLTLLVLHYLIQGARLVIHGHASARAYLRRMAVPGMLAEASLLPIAVVVVLIYHPDRPLGFVLLGVTYLLINYVFNRLSHIQEDLRLRVVELETLNRTAHAMASTLQLHELVESIARETLAAIPEAELFSLSRLEKGGQLVVDWLDRDVGKFERLHARADEGVTAWVIEHRRPVCVPDLDRAGDAFGFAVKNDIGVRSWLGVPIIVYEEVIGVLSLQSREKGVFGAEHQRVLEAIGSQAAVAIQNARLYELATVDGLTNLYVRRYFDTRLREELERSRRFDVSFSVVLLDIDDFKKLNDTYGHALGDRVLREVAGSMRRNMRGVDLAARYGGEEFAFILPRTSMIDAHAVAERIRADIGEVRIVHEGKVLKVTASLGIACWPESGPGDAPILLERADVALYRAKATGKNRVELYWSADQDEKPAVPTATVRKLRPAP